MIYVDTSLIVAALCIEDASDKARSWLAEGDAAGMAISDWVITEVSSALAVKLRTSQIDLPERAKALALFAKLVVESFTVLPVSSPQFRAAAHLVDQSTLGLRAGDALHLAIASDHGAILYTLDRKLAKSGPMAGISTRLFAYAG